MSKSSEDPVLIEITEVQMYNPQTDDEHPIKRADFEGITDIFDDDQVNELRDEGWFTRGITGKFEYKKRVYKVTVSGNSRLGYVKVENIEDLDHGRELHTIIRDKYLDNFRIYPEVL
ncbi:MULTISPECIES: hypothetical protein [unclassified Haloferax]|uniref:hypothetical protein n=1 Tax=unclassified Haloferax TaxID=2625095 RepID=UPI00126706DC|nr:MULTISPECIES: hypothetical protein [unclassified Haloferax]